MVDYDHYLRKLCQEGGGGGGLKGAPSMPAIVPPKPEKPPAIPMRTEADLEMEKDKQARLLLSRQGRQSTILTQGMDLGQPDVAKKVALGA